MLEDIIRKKSVIELDDVVFTRIWFDRPVTIKYTHGKKAVKVEAIFDRKEKDFSVVFYSLIENGVLGSIRWITKKGSLYRIIENQIKGGKNVYKSSSKDL